MGQYSNRDLPFVDDFPNLSQELNASSLVNLIETIYIVQNGSENCRMATNGLSFSVGDWMRGGGKEYCTITFAYFDESEQAIEFKY